MPPSGGGAIATAAENANPALMLPAPAGAEISGPSETLRGTGATSAMQINKNGNTPPQWVNDTPSLIPSGTSDGLSVRNNAAGVTVSMSRSDTNRRKG